MHKDRSPTLPKSPPEPDLHPSHQTPQFPQSPPLNRLANNPSINALSAPLFTFPYTLTSTDNTSIDRYKPTPSARFHRRIRGMPIHGYSIPKKKVKISSSKILIAVGREERKKQETAIRGGVGVCNLPHIDSKGQNVLILSH